MMMMMILAMIWILDNNAAGADDSDGADDGSDDTNGAEDGGVDGADDGDADRDIEAEHWVFVPEAGLGQNALTPPYLPSRSSSSPCPSRSSSSSTDCPTYRAIIIIN